MLRYFILGTFFIIGVAKSYVFYMEKNVASLKKRIKKEKDSINLLKVEWTYLNQSSRLLKLSDLYLKNWKQISPDQMKSIEDIKKLIESKNYSQANIFIENKQNNALDKPKSVNVDDSIKVANENKLSDAVKNINAEHSFQVVKNNKLSNKLEKNNVDNNVKVAKLDANNNSKVSKTSKEKKNANSKKQISYILTVKNNK